MRVKVEARRQELEALAADTDEAERKCQLQSDEPESYSADLTRIFAAKVNHRSRIAKLTAMREANVTVTTVEHSKSVRLPVGVLVDMSCLAAGVSMLWWPPSKNESEGDAQSRTDESGGEGLADGGGSGRGCVLASVGLGRQRGGRI